ncbi:MAG TPA: malectin [Candidatus Solibacter sp.]|nr:malectin [Candidatus Solibacter sp.]
MFFVWNDQAPFGQMLRNYTYLSSMWYRPTAFSVPYWIVEQFFSWHNLFAWKLAHFLTALAAAYAVYWLVVQPLGGNRMAGLLGATYFIAQPSLYSAVMEAAGFDFLHILLTVLCAGFYILGARTTGRKCALMTSISWLLFLIAVTAKEAALATPGFLLIVSTLTLWLEPHGSSWVPRVRREALRLLPYFAALTVYYFAHVARIPPANFTATGQYRDTASLPVILANCRKFPLWIARIYAWSDQTLQIKMYQSTIWNNLAGIGALVLMFWQWRRIVRGKPAFRRVLLLMLAWMAVYLVLPIYAGGYLWHINLAVVGYSVLFGIAVAGFFTSVKRPSARRTVVLIFFLTWLFLSREDLRIELEAGSHATGYRINHSLIEHPPVAAAALGKAPLIYIEDRLGMGPWWYGCFGNLFKFVYLRHDLDEVIVPLMPSLSHEARNKWLANGNAFFFRYDDNYDWHDASAEFRAAIVNRGGLQAGEACRTGLPYGGRWPIRVAAGRPGRIEAAGILWEADSDYDGGKTYSTVKSVAGTVTPELYQSERFDEGRFEYRFCVPDGVYNVKLKFAEIWFDAAGKRIFDVALNGTKVLTHFDIAAVAKGASRAIDREFLTTVGDGRMVIQFLPVVSNPKVSAIEISPSLPRSRQD